jgi:hypothetical protein
MVDIYVFDRVKDEMLKIMERVGSDAGENLAELYKIGEITSGQQVKVVLPIGNFQSSRTPLLTRAIVKIGSEEWADSMNLGIAGCGLYTGGSSAIYLSQATDFKAKNCYRLSIFCSGCAVVAGSGAVLARTCQISKIALVSEMWGYAFLKLGNEAQRLAVKIESQTVPTRQRRPIAFGLYTGTGRNSAFITSSNMSASNLIARIPFQQIGQAVGFAISIYAYRKIIIIVYRYGKRLILGYKKRKLRRAAKLFTALIYWKSKNLRVYRLAAIKRS